MLPEFFQFHNPTKVIYGQGLSQDFAHELHALGVQNFFIVSDNIIDKLGLIDKVSKSLEAEGIKITGKYTQVEQDAEITAVKAIAQQAKETGADGIIAIGGGSVIDASKAANIIFSVGGDLMEDFSGAHLLTKPIKPFVVIPTTAGTGSECTFVSMIYDATTKVKMAFAEKFSLPDIAILDPEVTQSLPPKLTASTGMDALTHAIEATVGIEWSPVSDSLAFAAIDLIFNNIVKAVKNGDDLEARGAMLVASNLAGIAFSHSMVGCVHGMAHAAGGLYRVPHGVANSIFLPHGMEYNFEEVKEKFAKLAPIMGVNTTGMTIEEAARKSIEAVRKLTVQLNELDAIPLRLRDVGVPEDGLIKIAEATMDDGTCFYNPREVDADIIIENIKNAY